MITQQKYEASRQWLIEYLLYGDVTDVYLTCTRLGLEYKGRKISALHVERSYRYDAIRMEFLSLKSDSYNPVFYVINMSEYAIRKYIIKVATALKNKESV